MSGRGEAEALADAGSSSIIADEVEIAEELALMLAVELNSITPGRQAGLPGEYCSPGRTDTPRSSAGRSPHSPYCPWASTFPSYERPPLRG